MIQIEELTKYYGSFCALERISFEIRQGEILGLLGPNGAGKSTTLRILTCFMRPSSGTVRVKDFDIHQDPITIKKLIGYLPESAPLYPDMLVHEYLHYVADIRQLAPDRKEARIRELAGLCGLNEVMHKAVHELSKGFKQRVGLAHAMMGDPEILVLDEPTSGLDPNQIVEIRDIIRRIGREKTVVLSTHILSEAEATCDRVVIINRGRIVADGATESLKRDAGSSYTIQLTLEAGDEASVRQQLETLPEINAVQRNDEGPEGALALRLSCDTERDLRPGVFDLVRRNDWPLLELHRESRTLETIFRKLTKEG